MKSRVRLLAVSLMPLAALLVAGCSGTDWIKGLTPEEATFARTYLDSIRAGNTEVSRRYLDPRLIGPDIDRRLAALGDHFPSGQVIEVSLVAYQFHESWTEGELTAEFGFQYHCEGGWALAEIGLKRTTSDTFVNDIKIHTLRESLESTNSFKITGKSPKHCIFLGLAIMIPPFVVWTAAVCLRTPIPRRKWLWLLFILFGLASFSLNWSSGSSDFDLVRICLLSVTAEKAGPYAPLHLSISIPLGALVFLTQRSTLMRGARGEGTPGPKSSKPSS
jgi:hypothetical protein